MILLLLFLLALLPTTTSAQTGVVSGASVVPTGGSVPQTVADTAAQQGVALDAFSQPGDPSYADAITRACAAGVPILLKAKTYTVNNFSGCNGASFVLRGVPGKSIIQRGAASGSNFFTVGATEVLIDGVTFDMNSSSVSANQWGVLFNSGGQTINIRQSVFENNSGSIGSCLAILGTGPGVGGSFNVSDNEITNCTLNALYLGSVSNGLVKGNYIHDTSGIGIFAGSNGAASGTNYLTNVAIEQNRVFRSTGLCIGVGGIASPWSFGTPQATQVNVSNNIIQDCTSYGIELEGDYLTATGNRITQSSPSYTMAGAIDTTMRYGRIQNNQIVLSSGFTIDTGGSQEMLISGNEVTQSVGAAFNIGGNLNTRLENNTAILSGTAIFATVFDVETTGSGDAFPTVASGITITDNTMMLTGASTAGVEVFDNAGGNVGATALAVTNNNCVTSGGASLPSCLMWRGGSHTIAIDRNRINGATLVFTDPNGNGDVLFDWLQLGGTIQGISSTSDIRSFIPRDSNTYGAGGSVLWITPTATGSGYTAATVINISGTGCTGQATTPLLNSGHLIGVRVTNVGSGCSGTVTATASDTGGGTGATLSVGTKPQLPDASTIRWVPAVTQVLKTTGGFMTISYDNPLQLSGTNGIRSAVELQAVYGGTGWLLRSYTQPTFAIGSLPPSNTTACDATRSGARVFVTGSVSGAWEARCNGTNWISPSGSTIN